MNEGFLFVRDSQLSRSMGELRQSYLYEPDSDGNVVAEEDSAVSLISSHMTQPGVTLSESSHQLIQV